MTSNLTKRAAAIAVALFGALAVAQPALAFVNAHPAPPAQNLASGKWGATPSTTALTFGASNATQLYVTVSNTGQLPLGGASYSISFTNGKNNTTLSLIACTGGTWNQSTGACSGTQRTIVTSTGPVGTASTAVAGCFPMGVGASITLQDSLSKNPNSNTLGSLSVAVTRAQVRAATTSNS